jgi:hypothetical protein
MIGFSTLDSALISPSFDNCMFFSRCASFAKRTMPMHRSTLSINHRLPNTGTMGMHLPAIYPSSRRIFPPDIRYRRTRLRLIVRSRTITEPMASSVCASVSSFSKSDSRYFSSLPSSA